MTAPADAAAPHLEDSWQHLATLPDRLGEGPWDSVFGFTIPGAVRSKSNYRHSGKTSWKQVSGFEDEVFLTARSAVPPTWTPPDAAHQPGSRPLVVAVLIGRTMLDAANMSKSVLDACEGAVYVKDSQVRGCLEMAVPALKDQGLVACFAQLPPAAGLAQISRALQTLQDQMFRR